MDTDPDETICKEKLEQTNLVLDPRMKEECGWCFLRPQDPVELGPVSQRHGHLDIVFGLGRAQPQRRGTSP